MREVVAAEGEGRRFEVTFRKTKSTRSGVRSRKVLVRCSTFTESERP
eukprot:SAG11_NODE_26_length_23420_cov_40.459886_6_plen_47_part_00